jgi:hypothetical protein
LPSIVKVDTDFSIKKRRKHSIGRLPGPLLKRLSQKTRRW